jgi:hypothetical protein
MLTCGVVLLHDSARPHTAAHTRALLEHLKWELYDHPPYSPVLAPRDYHLFTYVKKGLRSQRFSNDESWCKVSKRGWARRWQTSLTQTYKNLFPDTSASILTVTALRSSLSIYVFFVCNKLFTFQITLVLFNWTLCYVRGVSCFQVTMHFLKCIRWTQHFWGLVLLLFWGGCPFLRNAWCTQHFDEVHLTFITLQEFVLLPFSGICPLSEDCLMYTSLWQLVLLPLWGDNPLSEVHLVLTKFWEFYSSL